MADAVLKDLPKEWNGVVVMDWSGGFWDKMKKGQSRVIFAFNIYIQGHLNA